LPKKMSAAVKTALSQLDPSGQAQMHGNGKGRTTELTTLLRK